MEMDPTATQAAPVAVATGGRLRLTPAQRLQLVRRVRLLLLEDVLTPDEIGRMKEALYRLKAEPDPAAHRVYAHRHGEHHVLFGHLVEYDPALLEYAAHPKLVPLVEEVVGGSVRLEESEAIINRRDPNADLSAWAGRASSPSASTRARATAGAPTWKTTTSTACSSRRWPI